MLSDKKPMLLLFAHSYKRCFPNYTWLWTVTQYLWILMLVQMHAWLWPYLPAEKPMNPVRIGLGYFGRSYLKQIHNILALHRIPDSDNGSYLYPGPRDPQETPIR